VIIDKLVLKRGLVVYLILAFGLAWAAQIALVVLMRSGAQVGSLPGSSLVSAAALMWPPTVGALVSRQFIEGHNFGDAGLRWPRWGYVLFAWFLPALLMLAALVISLPVYHLDTSLTVLRRLDPASPETALAIQVAEALTVAIPINAIFAFGEEFGWRGYLLPRLQQLLGYWPGLLGHGAIWGLWHAPLIVLAGYEYPRHHYLGVPLFIVFAALAGTILGWLRLETDSIVPSTIVHAGVNAIGGLPLVLLGSFDTAIGGVMFSLLGFIVLLAFIAYLIVSHRLPPARMALGRERNT